MGDKSKGRTATTLDGRPAQALLHRGRVRGHKVDEVLRIRDGGPVRAWFQVGLDANGGYRTDSESRPACHIPTGHERSVISTEDKNQTTHEGEGHVQVFAILPHALPFKYIGFLAIYGEADA